MAIPNWGKWLIDVGRGLASQANSEYRFVASICLPTRAYASAFLALGSMISASSQVKPVSNLIEHFELLSNLPRGTPLVWYKQGSSGMARMNGKVEGVSIYEGERRLCIRTQNSRGGNLTYLLTPGDCATVTISSKERKLPKRQRGRRVSFNTGFVEKILGEQFDQVDYISAGEPVSAIVGPTGVLRREINDTILGVLSGTEVRQGTFNDVLRVRRFLGETEPYRSEIYSTRFLDRSMLSLSPQFTIFDGPLSFLKWRAMFEDANWFVIMDWTQLHLEEAVDVVNAGYITSATPRLPNMRLPSLPEGTDISVYWERME